MRRFATVIVAVVAVLLTGGGWVLVANDYALREERVSIPFDGGVLDGILATPPEPGPRPAGLVVFVHGDGPVDATAAGFYRPIWESLAAAGYASLSWSKAGVGASTGNWLHQSLGDRAREVGAAVDWAARRPGIDRRRIGLWGASQGGWVVPGVAAGRDDVTFVIAASPAVNWLRQGRYNLLAELEHDGVDAAGRAAAVAAADRTRELLERGASWREYRAATLETHPMTEARWGFVMRNFRADATADLTAMGRRGVPTLLLLGEDDRNVDADETERTYRDLLGDALTVRRFPGAAHSLARTDVEDDAVWGTIVGVMAPRRVFADGYLEAQRDFLARLPADDGRE
ncbi:hypothetical protein FHS43_001922 [Streptosporangium becharense]|uniref:Alpha-beta hydrolase superfamily lysophospholipase n=1 Tax=Streptosporangium becharense TaxID=1816182 RepID=A0A7W9IAY5_9ACTN|nr:alpha/beta hydrolase [Streptosporangium becharense]MBB2910659.1 hypothetical protein [Streptosporangium becharense]MBB5817354.1 alpha-beta hydrolase superfamily lysophospholipase [Streptosporangium becharense]